MKILTLIVAGILPACLAAAQISITTATLSYFQDFNTLDTSGSALTAMPSGWSFHEWGGASANTAYRASTGSSTSGDTYSFGLAGSAERALGSLCSGGVPNVSYGARFVNNTGAYINAVTLTYKAEQWRRNGSANIDSVRFFYSTAPGRSIADTALSAWTEVQALLMTSVTTALPASAVNGNDTAKVISATFALSLSAGDTMSIRWYDYNAAGNDDGLSIDSLTVAFNIGMPSVSYKPVVLSLSPPPNTTIPSAAANLAITFDRDVAKGASGNIYIKDRLAQTTQTIAAASGNVAVSGNVAAIAGVGLQAGKTYHVTFDSTAFDTAGYYSYGLYDTTVWQFATIAAGAWLPPPAGLAFSLVNPACNGLITIRCTLPVDADVTATVFDMDGRSMLSRHYHAARGDNLLLMQTALPPGTYAVCLDDGRRQGGALVVMP
jgi:hypothetical protein